MSGEVGVNDDEPVSGEVDSGDEVDNPEGALALTEGGSDSHYCELLDCSPILAD